MHSATRLDDLKILECFLQNSLHAHLGRIVPFRVQCLYKDETLWVLAQHPADVSIDIPDTFNVLERTLQTEEPKTPLAVRLYLRAEGNQRPYSHQSFTVYPAVKKHIPGEAAPAMTGAHEDRQALDRDRQDLSPGQPLNIEEDRHDLSPGQPLNIEEDRMDNSSALTTTNSTVADLVLPDNSDDTSGSVSDNIVNLETEGFVADIENAFGTPSGFHQSVYPAESKPKRKLLLPLLGGLGLLAAGSGAAYMGTRPCVLSTCTELSAAADLTQSALTTLKNPSATGGDVLTAQKQLDRSVEALNSIPAWSGSYGKAQTALKTTVPVANDTDAAVASMNKAYKAAVLVKTPPIPLATWQQSKQMWTESIAGLSKIPNSSQIYPLVQQKLTDYRGRLADIDRRIEMETTAEQKLKSALDGVAVATKAQATATSLPEWKEVKSQWDRVSADVGNIPPGTTLYPRGQEILKNHQPLISTARDKVLEEDKAGVNYQNAIKLAATAKQLQKSNQMPQAVVQWNRAVTTIQSIPQNSSVYAQAKPLIDDYTKSFQQADALLKNNQKVVQADRDLQKTCAGTPQICSFSVSNKGIVVRLMPLYTRTLSQTAAAANTQGDRAAREGIINHVNTLGKALQTIGDNTKLPIEIYGADGKQISNYRPQG